MEFNESRERKIRKDILDRFDKEVSDRKFILLDSLKEITDKIEASKVLYESSLTGVSENNKKILEQEEYLSKLKLECSEVEKFKNDTHDLVTSYLLAIDKNKIIIKEQDEKITNNSIESETILQKNTELLSVQKELSNTIYESEKTLNLLRKDILDGTAIIESLKKRHEELVENSNEVSNGITEAIEAFRIFEQRIHQFSEDTGYVVGYKDPSELIKNI